MKTTFLLIGMSMISFMMLSCSNKFIIEPGNPVQEEVIQEVTKKLGTYQLHVYSIGHKNSRSLVTGTGLTSCTTNRQPFSDHKKADEFVSEVLKVMIDIVEAPKNRLYLKEFPINRKQTTLAIYFIDPISGAAPQPPYYLKIGFDGFGFFAKYAPKNWQAELFSEHIELCKRPLWFKTICDKTSQFADRYAEQHQLNHYYTGFCTPGLHEIAECSFALASDRCVQIDEAKQLAHDCVSKYMSFISELPSTKEYFSGIYPRSPGEISGFQTEYVGIRIGFWTKEMNRVMPPYIAEIRFFNNKYHYYQADPETQSLVLVCEEPYEESRKDG